MMWLPCSVAVLILVIGHSVGYTEATADLRHSPRLVAVTFSSDFDLRVAVPLSTSERHGFFPVILGYGVPVGWGSGLGRKVKLIQQYVNDNTSPDDVVIIFDAYDVLFQAGEAEIVNRFLEMEVRHNRSLFMNAETHCTSPRKQDYPSIESPWRYVNSGVVVGRAREILALYRSARFKGGSPTHGDRLTLRESTEPLQVVDARGELQNLNNWHTDYYLDHPDVAALDSGCELIQNVWNVHGVCSSAEQRNQEGEQGTALKFSDGRVVNELLGTKPLVLHFPGPGHWPTLRHPERFGTCCQYEVFRAEPGNPNLARIMEDRHLAPWKEMCSGFRTTFDKLADQLRLTGDAFLICWWQTSSWPLVAVLVVVMVGLSCRIMVFAHRPRLRLRQSAAESCMKEM